MKNQVTRMLKIKEFWKYRLRNILKHIIVSVSVIMFLHLYNDSGWSVSQKFVYALSYGVFIGIVEDLFSFTMFRSMKSGIRIPIRLVYLTIVNIACIILVQMLFSLSDDSLGKQFYDILAWEFNKVNSRRPIIILLSIAFIIIFFSELELIVGQSYLKDYFTGKLKKPRKENRAFMFLDLKNSTTITEIIGDERYNNLINDCYFLLSTPISNTGADIVKYIGDEVILTWRMSPKRDATRCLSFFYQFKEQLEERRKYFEDKYGFFPQFKAGVHSGKVVTSYVGHIKKQRDFTGDVMNTTARIIGKCNEYDASFMCSKSFFDKTDKSRFSYDIIPSVTLKGKKNEVDIVKLKGLKDMEESIASSIETDVV